MSASINKRIYDLLPVVHRMRDSEQGWPLRALLDIIQEQVDSAKVNIDQLYDDWFIETCAEWVVPYIGDLLGVGPLASVSDRMFSLRSFIGNTVAFRRRKGTVLALESLSKALTRWPAVAVEYFQLLAWTQHLSHVRITAGGTAKVSESDAMRRLETPFEKTAHTVDVRRISSKRGKFNIPNIGEFLWRLQAYPIEGALATLVVDKNGYGFSFSQLGKDIPLFNPPRDKPVDSRNIESDLPLPLPRRPLYDQLNAWRAGAEEKATDWDIRRAINISWLDSAGSHNVEPEQMFIADLTQWCHPHSALPPASPPLPRLPQVAVDPVLGRFTFPVDIVPTKVEVSYWTGFSSEVGGGCYNRIPIESPYLQDAPVQCVPSCDPEGHPGDPTQTLGQALTAACALPNAIVQITDNSSYQLVDIEVLGNQILELSAANEKRPVLLGNGQTPWRITLHKGASLRIAGLLVNARIEVTYCDDSDGSNPNTLLLISHCTLVPGVGVESGQPPLPSVTVKEQILVPGGPVKGTIKPSSPTVEETTPLHLVIERSICGAISHPSKFGRVEIRDSAVDILGNKDVKAVESGVTVVERSTILGPMSVYLMELGSNSIFDGELQVMRTQDGCVRYSFVPFKLDVSLMLEPQLDSKAPRRYHCQPVMAIADAREAAQRQHTSDSVAITETLARVRPRYTSVKYGDPGYLQLAQSCPPEIASGASDEAEMGVFNHLGQPERLKNLGSVLNEYLRVGLDAGVFLVT